MVCLGRYFSDWSKKTLWGSFVRKQNLILFLFCPFVLKRSFDRRMKSVKIYKNCKCRYLQDFELYHGRPQSGQASFRLRFFPVQYLRFGYIVSVMLVQASCIFTPNCRWQCSLFVFKRFNSQNITGMPGLLGV